MTDGQAMPPDPFHGLMQGAIAITELYNNYVKAGMPPISAAILLGTWMGVMSAQNQQEAPPPS